MREFLFKAKRKDNGEWVEGFLCLKNIIKHTRKCFDWRGDYVCDSVEEHKVDSETVGQFTGLTDNNGKKIFEGDIVELYDKNDDVKWKAVVVFGNPYSNYSWGWELLYIGQNPKINTDILCWVEMEETGAYCEVIGNIYDNPELLGEKQ